jgi:arabinofuranosyltransferase
MSLDRGLSVAAYVCAAVLVITFIVRTAWICDDAYITARTIDNWLQGYGLRWNVAERVQTFTHPLWLFVEAAAWRVSGGPYWSSMAVSIVCASCAAMLVTTIDGVSRPFFS